MNSDKPCTSCDGVLHGGPVYKAGLLHYVSLLTESLAQKQDNTHKRHVNSNTEVFNQLHRIPITHMGRYILSNWASQRFPLLVNLAKCGIIDY